MEPEFANMKTVQVNFITTEEERKMIEQDCAHWEQVFASKRTKMVQQIASLNLMTTEVERNKFVHLLLLLTEPLLIDEDYDARIEGREIITNLSNAVGLSTMINAMRPDIDCLDDCVRDAAARSFSIVASAVGVNAVLPFLRETCQSKRSWQARCTGVMIVQQIAFLVGSAGVLPHMRSLVEIVEARLDDDRPKVRTIAALALGALAHAAAL